MLGVLWLFCLSVLWPPLVVEAREHHRGVIIEAMDAVNQTIKLLKKCFSEEATVLKMELAGVLHLQSYSKEISKDLKSLIKV
ncbi:hypothetical protein CRUP_035489, partial [Coryphaenoides rupestris]